METITIRTFGEFSLEANGVTISDTGNRARKVWCLLAYLICSRNRIVSQKKLIDLLWSEDTTSANPENALRITLHRLRAMLDQLWPDAGRELILHKSSGYCWNPDAPIHLDHEDFEGLITGVYPSEEEKIDRYLYALSLYKGEFLPKHCNELWAIPIAAHFHNHYLMLTIEASEMLMHHRRYEEAVSLCRTAVQHDPYHEGLCQLLMRALGGKGDTKGAENVYESLRKRLMEDFGIQPSEETWQVYRSVVHSTGEHTLQIDEVLSQLQEKSAPNGALVCDYDYFKVLCFSESRSLVRNGHQTHVALLGIVESSSGEPLSRRTVNQAMDNLEQVLMANLRLGDAIARCSTSQFIVMLPKANYDDSCMVSRRLLAAYRRAHPRSTVNLQFIVQPLTPVTRMP